MSSAQLAALDAERAFRPRVRFHELAGDHVPFDELTCRSDTEAALRRAIEQDEGVIAVIGGSGAGKSSVIAAVAADLPERHLPLHIGVAALGGAATDAVSFVQHVLREVTVQASAAMTGDQRSAIARASADSTTRQGPQTRGGAQLGAEAGRLYGEIVGARLDQIVAQNAAQAMEGLDRLVSIFVERKRTPLLIVEDTDAWVKTGNEEGDSIADGFFTNNVSLLARRSELTAIVAVQHEHRARPSFQDVRAALAAEVTIPRLDEPSAAIAAILRHRLDRSEVSCALDDVVEPEAIARLEAEYDASAGSLRHVLAVADRALELAGPEFPDRLSWDHVRAGVAHLRAD